MLSREERARLMRRLRSARRRETAARADLQAAVVEAKAAGVPVREIAEAGGFKTRKAVYDLVKRTR